MSSLIGKWLGFSKLLPAAASAAMAVYDRVVGKSPRLNFDTTSGGIELHVFNTRDETIIVETIQASPPLLAFSEGEALRDTIRAASGQVNGPDTDRPIAVVSPGQKAEIRILRTKLEGNQPDQLICVTVSWRTARRRRFSRSSISIQVSVRDIRDLLVEVGRKQPGVMLV
ncbi:MULTISPECIES: hypothetical protein [Bradyrhizobium]|uniref:hypothetical protein n=1 Tax=Bradyrhizobium TaxID=374 RepID=UPI00041AB3D8|nr:MULTISPECIES: hypothetical protein [Bradyrhizobium]UFW46286.1 hypothetical protein BaraCB756_28705 [Bradyrhizobium arachidis]